jgi:MYXO-CTERM domain-containing protein
MRRSGAVVAAAALAAAVLGVGRAGRAQCSGGSACPPCTQCRVAPASGSNPSVAEMSTLFDRIAAGPQAYGTLGWNFGGRTTIGAGPGWCGTSGRRDTVPVTFPCVLLKAIYLTESSWRQFCSTNQTVISFDCGYGIAQVTSGMRRGETSSYDAARVASSAAYNVSVGAAILADKWRASPCVGLNDPQIIEDWYFSVWGYNGFSFRNNPNNPMFRADRPEFRTPGVASAQVRSNYPYQELVWGYSRYPLTTAHYRGIALVYPNRAEICRDCARPPTGISEPPGSHRGGCDTTTPMDAGVPRDVGVDTGVRVDTGRDVGVDTGRDVGFDTGRDVGFDTGQDVGVDVGVDTGVDAGAPADVGAPADDTGPVQELPDEGPGCGCRTAGGGAPSRGAAGALGALWALTATWWRQTRRRRARSAAR